MEAVKKDGTTIKVPAGNHWYHFGLHGFMELNDKKQPSTALYSCFATSSTKALLKGKAFSERNANLLERMRKTTSEAYRKKLGKRLV